MTWLLSPPETVVDAMEPEGLPALESTLGHRGWDESDVRAVMGENFLRVANAACR
jgi:microsomal dipeptidase-like Zn-dependent dipeptidase